MKYTKAEHRFLMRYERKLSTTNIYDTKTMHDFLISEIRKAEKKAFEKGRQSEQHMMYLVDTNNFKLKNDREKNTWTKGSKLQIKDINELVGV